MENNLSQRLQMAVRRLSGKAFLTDKDIDEMMREVRLSLLEADVNFRVVKEFVAKTKEEALGEKILKGLNPGQQVIKVVHDQLKTTLGEEAVEVDLNKHGITTIMTIGLQGSGKTTAIGKLAVYLRKTYKKKVLLIAADIYRPAAIDQLVTIGKQIDVEVFELGQIKATSIVTQGLDYARKHSFDIVIIDTAGRLHIDEEMMQELIDVKEIANPNEILLTVDAMTGQDAANIAKSFHDQLGATGAILTKLDGDTRGGAALSIRSVSGIPIKFASAGEKMDTFEVFHPDRIASRILGMGDVLTLIEKATDSIDEEEAKNMMEKMMSNQFNYHDLLKQFKMIKRMGSFSKILGFIPGMGQVKKQLKDADFSLFDSMQVLINSMTDAERKDPKLVDSSFKRRERIAKGAGLQVSDVNRLREALETQKKMFQKMGNMSEDEIEQMSKNPQAMLNQQRASKKGKGKNKGGFRY